jgi:hypothetical protein
MARAGTSKVQFEPMSEKVWRRRGVPRMEPQKTHSLAPLVIRRIWVFHALLRFVKARTRTSRRVSFLAFCAASLGVSFLNQLFMMKFWLYIEY